MKEIKKKYTAQTAQRAKEAGVRNLGVLVHNKNIKFVGNINNNTEIYK